MRGERLSGDEHDMCGGAELRQVLLIANKCSRCNPPGDNVSLPRITSHKIQ